MKLLTFGPLSCPELGVMTDRGVVPLNRLAPSLPRDMTSLLAEWHNVSPRIHDLADNTKEVLPVQEIDLRQPVLRPGKILAIGKNYAAHARETGADVPDKQIWFCKQPSAANGPHDAIEIPCVSNQVDYEAELVVVIGKRGRHIARETALSYVFGYCCGNDVSVRDWQKATPQWMLGKSFDTHAPFGPWITTADEIVDPQALDITCTVNGETRQSANTRDMVFSIAEQIAHVSQVMTLEPGDLIFTGTPEGVAMGMPEPKWLKAGDVVSVAIAGLGEIWNTCQLEQL